MSQLDAMAGLLTGGVNRRSRVSIRVAATSVNSKRKILSGGFMRTVYWAIRVGSASHSLAAESGRTWPNLLMRRFLTSAWLVGSELRGAHS